MSKHQIVSKLLSRRFMSVLTVILVMGVFSAPMAQGFQIRQADNLRTMKSKPFAQSPNFRVNADMFIQPSLKIRANDLVAQTPAPVVPVTPVTPVPVVPSGGGNNGSGGGGGGGGEKYDASNWILQQKYNELVKDREDSEQIAGPELDFDYRPTNPNDVELVGPSFVISTDPEPDLEPEAGVPSVPAPVENIEPPVNQVVQLPLNPPVSSNFNNNQTPEQVLINAPVDTENLMVVQLSQKQKKELLASQGNGFNWPWSRQETVLVEDFQASAPMDVNNTNTQACIGCEDVLWWSWCSFVVMILLLILLLLIINTLLQLALFKFRVDKYTPDNPKSFIYRMKKFLKQIGLLSLALVSVSSLAQAQVTTTPQLLIYEGELLDDAGVPVIGSYTFRFSFWDNSDYEATDVAGGVINAAAPDYRGWSEVQTTSTIADGSFSLQMSDGTPFTPGLFDQDNLFLQVEVKNAGDPDTAYEFVDINLSDPTEDRKIIASVPFAFNANKLDYRDLGFGSGNIPYLDIAGLLPNTVIPDLDLTASDLDLTDITLSDFTNDLALNDGQVFVGDAANVATAVNISGDGTLDNAGVFTLALDSIGEDELDFGTVTLADFTNDVGFVTTDTLGDLACGLNEIAKWDGTAWICAPDAGGSAFTASDGITLTGSNFTNDFSTSIETGEITDGTITGADLNFGDITLADFTNDAGFITSDTNTTYTGSGGITLTGTDFTADLGTDIETAEIQDDAVTTDKIGGAGVNQVLTSDASGNPQWEDRSNFAISALTTNNIFVGNGAGVATDTAVSGDLTMIGGNFQLAADAVESAEIADDAVSDAEIDFANVTLSDFTNDAGFVTTDNDTTYTAGTGIDLSGTTLSSTLGTEIDSSEIVNGSVSAIDLNFGDITLADFTNDAGFLTTVDISANTNLAAGTGVTLTGDTLSVDLGTDINTGEILDGTIADEDLNLSDITLADFTNDAGFITTDNDTTYTAGTGVNLIGTTFSTTLGAEIDSSEIVNGSIGGIDLNFGDITLADFTNDAGFLTSVDVSDNTNLTAGTGATLVGDQITVNVGDTIEGSEITDGTVADEDLDLSDITLADFTNDAGFVTTDNDTTYTAGTGVNLIGTTLSTTLGTEIDSSEIANGSINGIDLNFGDITLADFTNDAGFLTSVDVSDNTNLTAGTGATLVGDQITVNVGDTIEGSEITDGTVAQADLNLADITLADFTNDAGFITTDNDTTYLAGAGLTLSGNTFSNNLGASIDATEIETNAVGDDEINYTAVTLNDFTNDAGFLNSVDISDNTNLAVGSGLTLIGDSIISDLGDSINSGEIVDGTITETDLNLTNITLDSFTNDAGFLDSVDISDNTNLAAGSGLTLTGDSLSSDLGTSIDAAEIETNAVADDAIDFSAVTLSDFTNDAGFITTDSDTLVDLACGINEIAKYNGAAWICAADAGGTSYTATDGVTLTGATFTNDFSTSIESNEITDGTIQDQDLDFTDITVADFVNDAGYITTDTDTLADLACATGEFARWNGTTWVCAGTPLEVSDVLSPRYPDSIFNADGTNNTGSMFEEEDTLASGILGTVIRWFSRQTVLHDYDMVVQWTVPDDFDSFQTPALSVDYKTSGLASDAVIDMMVFHNDDGIDELSASGMGLNSNGWTTTDFTLNGATTWVAGDTMKIRFKMKARDSNSAQTGNIVINYIRQ